MTSVSSRQGFETSVLILIVALVLAAGGALVWYSMGSAAEESDLVGDETLRDATDSGLSTARRTESSSPDPVPEESSENSRSQGSKAKHSITVRVLDAFGNPVPGARVVIQEAFVPAGRARLESAEVRKEVGRTDERGIWTREGPEEFYLLWFFKSGVGETDTVQLQAAPGVQVVRFKAQATIKGLVLNHLDEIVPGAIATAEQSVDATDRKGISWARMNWAPCHEDGRFELLVPAGQPFRLRVTGRQQQERILEFDSMDIGQEREVVVAFPGPSQIAGRVIDENGDPVPNARVTLYETNDKGLAFFNSRPIGSTRTDGSAGTYRLKIHKTGRFLLWAHAKNARATPQPLDVRESTEIGAPDLKLLMPRKLEVLVTGPGGIPVSGASLEATCAATREAMPKNRHLRTSPFQTMAAFTDKDGRAVIPHLHPEAMYVLTCRPTYTKLPVYYREGVKVSDEVYRFQVTPDEATCFTISGVLRWQTTGKPILDATVLLSGKIDDEEATTTMGKTKGPDGRFEFNGLQKGRDYHLLISSTVHAMISVDFESLAGDRFLELNARPYGALEIELRDPEGLPVADIGLLVRLGDESALYPERKTTTGEAGIAGFEKIRTGVHQILDPRDKSVMTKVEIQPAKTKRVKLIWAPQN